VCPSLAAVETVHKYLSICLSAGQYGAFSLEFKKPAIAQPAEAFQARRFRCHGSHRVSSGMLPITMARIRARSRPAFTVSVMPPA
jgi:hypothetical protein